MEAHKSGRPYFSCQSLLLNTTVLNDIYIKTHDSEPRGQEEAAVHDE